MEVEHYRKFVLKYSVSRNFHELSHDAYSIRLRRIIFRGENFTFRRDRHKVPNLILLRKCDRISDGLMVSILWIIKLILKSLKSSGQIMGGMTIIILFVCLYNQQSRCRVSSGESLKWDMDRMMLMGSLLPSINA